MSIKCYPLPLNGKFQQSIIKIVSPTGAAKQIALSKSHNQPLLIEFGDRIICLQGSVKLVFAFDDQSVGKVQLYAVPIHFQIKELTVNEQLKSEFVPQKRFQYLPTNRNIQAASGRFLMEE